MSDENSAAIVSIIVLVILGILAFTGHDVLIMFIIGAGMLALIGYFISDTLNKLASERAKRDNAHAKVRLWFAKEMQKIEDEKNG